MGAGDMAWGAFADPTRRQILRVVAERGELSAGDIATEVPHVGRTAVSAQLRVLWSAGLIKERRAGRHRLYSLHAGAADEIIVFLAALYRDSLGELKRRVEDLESDERADGRGSRTAG